MVDRPPTAAPANDEPEEDAERERDVEAGTAEQPARRRRGFFERLAALFTLNRKGPHGL
jgi:hypothetical protein